MLEGLSNRRLKSDFYHDQKSVDLRSLPNVTSISVLTQSQKLYNWQNRLIENNHLQNFYLFFFCDRNKGLELENST